ncbi:hypothetical protein BJV77DRAFT_980787 [Russula vinacea]|nr:hypothetical protein BJV77DRAFT_980787 [Russula vinacea]
MPAIINVSASLGAVLVGCFVAIALSGVVGFQACIYFRLYPNDKPLNKIMVAVVWILDITHTCLICSSIWNYLIANFGNVEAHVRGEVPVTVAISIMVTSFVTLITHLYFLRRLLHLSNFNWFIIGPTLVLAIGRVVSAMVTSVFLIQLKTFPAFTAKYAYMFTLGLAISSTIDVVITFGMCFYLQESRRGFGTMDEVIDSIIVYTINNGTLTCFSTIVSMVFWLTMRKNLIFMALHFVIAKMYANSLFATLNMRRKFRGRAVPPKESANAMPVLFPDSFNRGSRTRQAHIGSIDLDDEMDTKGLHITVEKTVQYDVDDDRGSGPSSYQNSPAIFPLEPSNVQV